MKTKYHIAFFETQFSYLLQYNRYQLNVIIGKRAASHRHSNKCPAENST